MKPTAKTALATPSKAAVAPKPSKKQKKKRKNAQGRKLGTRQDKNL